MIDARLDQENAQLEAERLRDELAEWAEDCEMAADRLNDVARVLADETAEAQEIRTARNELDRIDLSGPQAITDLESDIRTLREDMQDIEYEIENAEDDEDE